MMNCESPQFWAVDLKKTSSNEYELVFKFQKEVFIKKINQRTESELYQDCLILENRNCLKWDFQKFSFMSFEKDVDFKQMLKSQILFSS